MKNLTACFALFGLILGGTDRILGNRKGYGSEFERGFQMIGPTALSMVGIICLSNYLAAAVTAVFAPLLQLTGVDPAMLGGLFAIDMGGYQMSLTMAEQPELGRYAGTIVAATFGCTLVFTIPAGTALIDQKDQGGFAMGIVIGLFSLPVTLLAGGLAMSLSFWTILYQNLPSLLFCAGIGIACWKALRVTMKVFAAYVGILNFILTAGLVFGAAAQLFDYPAPGSFVALPEAMKVVCSIGVFLLGSLPATLFLKRILEKPMKRLGSRIGVNDASMTGLLAGCISPLPALLMLKEMDERGKIMNAAFLVSGTSLVGAHLAFVAANAPDQIGALLLAKGLGGLFAAAVACLLTRKKTFKRSSESHETGILQQ